MKAIAEYFRDLAADDRYFGAEPPIPDAEMLARIAEREVSRRVEARMDASGIVLRVGKAMDGGTNLTAAEPVPAPVPFSEPASPVAAAPSVAEQTRPIPPAPVMPPAPLPAGQRPLVRARPAVQPPHITAAPAPVMPKSTVPAHHDDDSVAAKLQRIRAVVGKGSAQLVPTEVTEDISDVPDFVADAASEPQLAAGPAAATSMETAAPLSPSEGPATDTEAQITPAPDESAEDMAADTIAAPAIAAHPTVEAEPARTPIRPRVIKMRRSDFERAIAAGALVEDATRSSLAEPVLDSDFAATGSAFQTLDDLPTDDLIAGDLAKVDLDFAELDAAAQTDESADLDDLARLDAVATATTALSAVEEADLQAELAALELDIGEPAIDADHPQLVAEEEFDEAEADDRDDTTEGAETEATAADTANDMKLTTILANLAQDDVVDTEALIMSPVQTREDVLETAPDLTTEEPDQVSADIASLAEVMRAANAGIAKPAPTAKEINLFAEDDADENDSNLDLDALESIGRHVANPVSPDDTADLDDDEAEDWAASHPHLRQEPDADEAALSRILTQTDVQLSQPEAKSRREAISQLKAAVAATEADRRLGEQKPIAAEREAESLFRDDLQQVVRPRRPLVLTADTRSERPRPAPLKLVASQRVDLPQVTSRPASVPAAQMPIRPRRVTIAPEAPVARAEPAAVRSQARTFAEFATEMGASGLGDLLEAAAAYTSFVEGVGDFSRPQILRKVNELTAEQFSREDGLRSFGTLLREGRIMKVSNGRFMVNEETRFNPVRNAG